MNFVSLCILCMRLLLLEAGTLRRVVVLKIKDKDDDGDDDDDIAYTGECLLPFLQEFSAFLFVF